MRRSTTRVACLVCGVTAGMFGRAAAQSHLDPPPQVLPTRTSAGPQVYTPNPKAFGTPSDPARPLPMAPRTSGFATPQNPPPALPAWSGQQQLPPQTRPAAYPTNSAAAAPSGVVPASASTTPGTHAIVTAAQPPANSPPAPFKQPNAPTLGGSQSPALVVEKRAPETILFGQPLSYEIVVRNAGSTPVYHVRVEDELPPNARYLGGDPVAEMGQGRIGWAVGTMEPLAEKRIRIELQPQAEGEIRSTAAVTFTTAAVMRTQVVQPRLAITVKSPEQALAGETVSLQIQASNPGTGTLAGLTLRGKLPPGLQHPQGTLVEADMGALGPGETRTVTLTTRAVQGGPQLAEITATGEGGLESTARASIQVLEASLKLRRSGPSRCFVKSEPTFELEVTNPGSAVATGAVLSDVLPVGFKFLSATEGGSYDEATRTITWRLVTVPPGSRRTVGYRVKAIDVGEQADRAVAQAERGLEARAETMFNVEGVPALQLEVVDLEDPIEAGGDLTYEVRVFNQGSCPCTNIQILAIVPEGLQAREASCAAPGVSHRMQGPQIVFDPLPKLAMKADVVYRMKVKGVLPGDYRFKVQMTCDQLRQPVNKEESSRVYKD